MENNNHHEDNIINNNPMTKLNKLTQVGEELKRLS